MTASAAARPTARSCERADRLAAALAGLGVEPGDRVATFMWNSREHLEAYLAVPCMGAVLHTLNVRLFAEQLTYIVNHAEDRVIVVATARSCPCSRSWRRPSRRSSTTSSSGTADTGSLPERAELRGPTRRAERGLRLPRARRPPGGGPLLHERHHGEPQGGPLLPPLEAAARAGPVHGRLDGPARRRPRDARGADVPRQRLGHALRLGGHRRRPGHARRGPERRGALHADHRGARDVLGGRADHLDGPAALRRRAPARPVRACGW